LRHDHHVAQADAADGQVALPVALGRHVLAGDLSPTFDHVLLALGGQRLLEPAGVLFDGHEFRLGFLQKLLVRADRPLADRPPALLDQLVQRLGAGRKSSPRS
jgi:hypothetical protein